MRELQVLLRNESASVDAGGWAADAARGGRPQAGGLGATIFVHAVAGGAETCARNSAASAAASAMSCPRDAERVAVAVGGCESAKREAAICGRAGGGCGCDDSPSRCTSTSAASTSGHVRPPSLLVGEIKASRPARPSSPISRSPEEDAGAPCGDAGATCGWPCRLASDAVFSDASVQRAPRDPRLARARDLRSPDISVAVGGVGRPHAFAIVSDCKTDSNTGSTHVSALTSCGVHRSH